jgi:hypothetical protein
MKWGVRKSRSSAHVTIRHPTNGRTAQVRYDPTTSHVEQDSEGRIHVKSSNPRHMKDIHAQITKAHVQLMDDAELKSHVSRMNLEKQYRDLNGHVSTSHGKKIAHKALKTGGEVALNSAKNVAQQRLTKVINDAIDASIKK